MRAKCRRSSFSLIFGFRGICGNLWQRVCFAHCRGFLRPAPLLCERHDDRATGATVGASHRTYGFFHRYHRYEDSGNADGRCAWRSLLVARILRARTDRSRHRMSFGGDVANGGSGASGSIPSGRHRRPTIFRGRRLGQIFHYDGSSWTRRRPCLRRKRRAGLYRACGVDRLPMSMPRWEDRPAARLLHFDGSEWSLVETGWTLPPESVWGFQDVWGDDTGHLFVVGDQMILHFDGTSWSQTVPIPGLWLRAIWGSSAVGRVCRGLRQRDRSLRRRGMDVDGDRPTSGP